MIDKTFIELKQELDSLGIISIESNELSENLIKEVIYIAKESPVNFKELAAKSERVAVE